MPARQPLTLAAVGDLQLGDSPTTVGYGFYSRYAGTSLEPLFADVKDRLSGADLVFGNLETTLVPPPAGSSGRSALQLRGEPAFAEDLRRVGFTVVNVANNHAVQHGDDTFHATVAAVRAAGVECCGIRGQGPWASEPVRLSAGGWNVGILGYCQRPRQYGSAVPPYAEGTLDEIRADVARLESEGRVVVVSLHWGEEFVPHPSHDEVVMGRAIIDAGASLILGHHPHVTRPVETYKSGLIAYSLGNFMGDMVWYSPFRRGTLLRCSLSGDGVMGEVFSTRLGDDYRPSMVEGKSEPLPQGQLRGLAADSYARAIHDTMRQQRFASYRFALVNIPKTPLRTLVQLAADTLRNKTAGVRRR